MLLTSLPLLLLSPLPAQELVPPSSKRWVFAGDEHAVVEHLGRECLRLQGTQAWLPDLEFEEGVIEFDIAASSARGFSGVAWHVREGGNYEHFYLRPHMAGSPDATQYTPVFNGVSGWQLYHGEGFGAPVDFVGDQWTHVRIVVAGSRAEVFVDSEEPQLVVRELMHGGGAGHVGLGASSFSPAYFSNFRVRRQEGLVLRGAVPKTPAALQERVERWSVSTPFPSTRLNNKTFLEAEDKDGLSWSPLDSEPTGVTNLARLHARTEEADTVFARVTLHSEESCVKPIRFGYSDRVRVFLNGQLLYAGDNTYRSRDDRYLGTIGAFDQLWAVLEPGENELLFAVSESFGGWGLLCQIPEPDGLRVE